MPGATVALLGDLAARREFGKVGTQSDIHLHEFKAEDRHITIIVPDRYPDKVPPLSYAVLGAHAAVLVISKLDARVGEQILAADAAGLTQGVIVLQNYVQADHVAPLTKDTCLQDWPVVEDFGAARALLSKVTVEAKEGDVLVPVDHHFDVKGVGAVVLGIVKQGTLKKGDSLYAWPGKVICPVRSIQIHDVDVNEAVPGDRVGLALRNTKADQLDRGMVLAPADANLRIVEGEFEVRLRRSRFAKTLSEGIVVHLGIGMQVVPVRVKSHPAAGETGAFVGIAERPFVHAPGDRFVLWHMDTQQRVVGGGAFGPNGS